MSIELMRTIVYLLDDLENLSEKELQALREGSIVQELVKKLNYKG